MAALTDSGTLVRMAYQGLLNLNVDADEVLRRCGLDPAQLYKPNLRTHFSAQPLFWEAAVELSGDPCIGLHLGENMPVYKGQILEYLLLSSTTFGDGLKRVLNYQRLISDAMHGEVTESPTPYLTNYFSEHRYLTPHLAEAMVVSLIRFLQSVSDDKFKPTRICFTHTAKTNLEEYQRVFQCPVEFNTQQFKLYFDSDILNYRSPYAEPELLSMHVQSADQHMQQLEKRDLIVEVRSQVGALLESGDITLERISAELCMSPRQLRHQLTVAGTSLQRIITQHRKSLSRRLLSQTDESIAEIVYLTGFSEPSTFYRAFKRWEGMTPIEYRQLNNINVQSH
ncbi:MAG: AraC family transcriptional regulator [Porticoccaceae bacterium]|jgi:AraC-like DNA-binding protein